MSDDTRTDESADQSTDDSAKLTKEQALGEEEVPEETKEAIEKERQERLDSDNRPDTAEVDNSQRDFDVKSGQFTDHEPDDSVGPYNDPNAEDGEMEA